MVAFLRQLFLNYGPTERSVRCVLHRVRCVLADFGTESHIADYPDVLPMMFEWVRTSKQGRVLPQDLCESRQQTSRKYILVPKRDQVLRLAPPLGLGIEGRMREALLV